MNTLLKQKKEEFLRTQVNKLCFMGTGGNEYKESLWNWIEKAIKEAREEGYKEGFTKGWNLTKGELPDKKEYITTIKKALPTHKGGVLTRSEVKKILDNL